MKILLARYHYRDTGLMVLAPMVLNDTLLILNKLCNTDQFNINEKNVNRMLSGKFKINFFRIDFALQCTLNDKS